MSFGQIIDRREQVKKHPTGRSHVDRDKSPRSILSVDAIVLHSMGFDWRDDLIHYDKINAHFAVLRSGIVLHLHDITEYLNASDGFNRRAIAIEFAGNPLSDRGKAHGRHGPHVPILAQIFAGRGLVQKLKNENGITHILSHRQSAGAKPGKKDRSNCPGPHIWYNVGEWARSIGLLDGGAGFFITGGLPIPETWRARSNDLTLEDMFRPSSDFGLDASFKKRPGGLLPLP